MPDCFVLQRRIDEVMLMVSVCLLKTVTRVPQTSQCTVSEMLKEFENDKAAGRYVIWLRFSMVLEGQDCRTENVVEFLRGDLIHC